MKKEIIYSSITGALALAAGYAIEIPSPDAPVPAQGPKLKMEKKAGVVDEIKPKNMLEAGKVAYLGIGGDPISKLLSLHLGLNKGVALHSVVDGSPAQKGGLKENDIITKLGDKEIASQNDMRAAIFNAKPGEKIEAAFIREGKKMKKNFTLGARPDFPINPNRNIEPNFNVFPFNDKQLPQDENLQKLLEQMQDRLQLEMPQIPGAREMPKGMMRQFKFELNGGESQESLKDNKGSLTLKKGPDGKKLTAKDLEGNTLFEGPFNTPEDKAAVPEDILKRAQGLDKGNRFKFKIQRR